MPEQITLGSTTVGRSVFGINPSLLKGGTIAQTVYIEILNRAPELIDLAYTVSKNSIKNAFDVFSYVSDNGGMISDPDTSDTLTVVGVGSSAVNDSSISYDSLYVYYTPPTGFNSEDSFTYAVSDGNSTVSANIKVTVVNDAPVCTPDYFVVAKNTKTVLNVLANDYDINSDTITIYSAGSGSVGTLVISDDKQNISYIPPPQIEPQIDSWEYQITDGSLYGSSFVFVKIVNTPPTGGDRVFNVPKNSTNNILDLSYTDEDMLDTVYVSMLTKPSRGSFQLVEYSAIDQVNYPTQDFYSVTTNTYKLIYTPESGTVYSESFQIKISDTIDVVTAKITINVVPVAPVAVNDTAYCSKNSNVTANVVSNDYSTSGDVLKLSFTSLETLYGGEIRMLDDNNVIYIPATNFVGTDYAPYYVNNTNSDGSTDGIFQSTGYLIVTVANTPPIAVADSFT
ncbi:hypothetical protein C9374_000393, partial [Naegleria lovaniensis]